LNFFEKRTRFEIPRQLVFLDGRKKEDDAFFRADSCEKPAEKNFRKEDEETEKRRFS
jgi:hypothetical protein